MGEIQRFKVLAKFSQFSQFSGLTLGNMNPGSQPLSLKFLLADDNQPLLYYNGGCL